MWAGLKSGWVVLAARAVLVGVLWGEDQQPFGGPDIMSFGEAAGQYQAARGLRRRILPLPLPRAAARAAGDLACPEGRRGTTTWAEWLSRHPPRPQ